MSASNARLGALALRVEDEQLTRERLRARPGAILDRLPRLPAELGERRRVAVGADVARDLGDLLVRDVQPVVALEGEEQVVPRDPGDRLRLEPQQLADAVILVDDVVAGPQVGEALQRAPDPDVGPGRPLAEDLGVREEDQVEVAQDEAAPRRRDREDEAGFAPARPRG